MDKYYASHDIALQRMLTLNRFWICYMLLLRIQLPKIKAPSVTLTVDLENEKAASFDN